jgi:hypothetical protein
MKLSQRAGSELGGRPHLRRPARVARPALDGSRADREAAQSALPRERGQRDPELAGIRGRSRLLTLLLLLSFPIGVAAAIYLEEFAPRNR